MRKDGGAGRKERRASGPPFRGGVGVRFFAPLILSDLHSMPRFRGTAHCVRWQSAYVRRAAPKGELNGCDEVMVLRPEEGRREKAFCEEVFGVRRSFILVVFAFLLGIWAFWGMTASAAERRFPSIRCAVDVPEGWEVEEDEENATVSMTAPDEDAAVMLTGIDEPGVSVGSGPSDDSSCS